MTPSKISDIHCVNFTWLDEGCFMNSPFFFVEKMAETLGILKKDCLDQQTVVVRSHLNLTDNTEVNKQ